MTGTPKSREMSDAEFLRRLANSVVSGWQNREMLKRIADRIERPVTDEVVRQLYAACYAACQHLDGEQYPDLIGPLHSALLKAKQHDLR